MTHAGSLLAASIAMATLSTPATLSAQMAPMAKDGPACPATPAALPPELAAFRTPVSLKAGDGGAARPAPAIVVGQAATLALLPRAKVTFPVELSRPQPDGHAGTAEIVIGSPGAYRIALGTGAWIEVAGAAALLRSVGHGHGPDCSGVRKMVDFALTPGRYTIEIAGNRDPRITVLAVRLP